MAVTKVYIIRHAEAEGNVYRRYHGWYDSNITANGIRQLDALAQHLSSVHFDAVYSSPLRRTLETARTATGNKVDIIIDDRLIEVGGGIWEDMAFGNQIRDYGYIIGRFPTDPDSRAEDGESFRMVYERVSHALNDILEKHSGQTICVVSHGLAIKALVTKVLFNNMEQRESVPRILNASVSLFEHENGAFTPVYINNCDHLIDCPTATAKHELWFRSAQADSDIQLAVNCWRDTWTIVHGTTNGFSDDYARSEFRRMLRNNRNSLRFAYDGDNFVGILALDTANITEDDCGHISLLMLTEEYRGMGLGVQLIGEATSIYRRLERSVLRLRADKNNTRAVKFYQKYGFSISSLDNGGDYILKKTIK